MPFRGLHFPTHTAIMHAYQSNGVLRLLLFCFSIGKSAGRPLRGASDIMLILAEGDGECEEELSWQHLRESCRGSRRWIRY